MSGAFDECIGSCLSNQDTAAGSPTLQVVPAKNPNPSPSPGDALVVERDVRTAIRKSLLAWYRKHRRDLPWRNAATPYHVWVSEVMLQQTRVEVVKDYFTRWMKLFPDISDLAAADEAEVLHAWQGLGYYSRAKRLREGAQFVRDHFGGRLPPEPERLREIPGIGPYSAGAISSIAFDRPSPLVDGNVIRVLTRLFALEGDPNKAALKKTLWDHAAELVPPTGAGDFNQGLMELGAVVCTPRKPACYDCPVRQSCQAFRLGRVNEFPQLPKKKAPTELSMVLLVVMHRGKIAVQTLPAEARWWAGLDSLPFAELPAGVTPVTWARRRARSLGDIESATLLSPHKHSVTRFKITLSPVLVRLASKKRISDFRWVSRAELDALALPAPHRAVLRDRLS